MISEIFRRWDGKLCSFKQAKVLRKCGYGTDVSFAEASATIDALAKNGWKRAQGGGQRTEDRGQRSEVGDQTRGQAEACTTNGEGDPAWN